MYVRMYYVRTYVCKLHGYIEICHTQTHMNGDPIRLIHLYRSMYIEQNKHIR